MASHSSRSLVVKRLTAVRSSLHAVARDLAAFEVVLRHYTPATAAAPKTTTRRRRPLSPKARASLKLQGQYMGHMRQLKPAQKVIVRAVLAKSGKQAAIRKAQELAGKRKAA